MDLCFSSLDTTEEKTEKDKTEKKENDEETQKKYDEEKREKEEYVNLDFEEDKEEPVITQHKKDSMINRFNYSDRAAQSYSNPSCVSKSLMFLQTKNEV